MKLDLSPFTKLLEGLIQEVPPNVEESLDVLTEIGVTNAKSSKIFKNRTGRLRSEISSLRNGSFARQVISPTEYAKWVEFGNRPGGTGERIYPKRAKALRFVINGKVLFRRWVRSHGPLPYMAPARQLVSTFLPDLINSRLERLVHKFSSQ